jgi:predicted RNA binding protein YcfA (HicA-like mRNA interferase family)
VTGKDVANALVNLGWKISEYQNNHIVLIREDHQASLSVPNVQFVARGVIKKLIKFAEINIGDQLISNEAIRETLLKQYQTHIDLYKHYLELSLKVNIFYYAITGAILSFYFTKAHNNDIIRYSLLLPILMSVFFAIIFIYSSIKLNVTRIEVFQIRDWLGLRTAPEFNVLKYFLIASASLFILVALGLIMLLTKFIIL